MEKVADLDPMVKRYAMVYHHCQKQMVALEAEPRILDCYKVLAKKDLTVSTTVSDPNARGHRHDSLAWFWTMASANHFVLDSSGQCHTEPQSPQLSPYWTALSR